jgi:hypothetical protein
MKLVQKATAVSFSNGPTCEGIEYSFGDKDMNIALVTVNGRYPETGYAMNEVCKEAGYVVGGSGMLGLESGEKTAVGPGDAVLLQPGEEYYWEGDSLEMIMPCSPAFYPEQHKKV